MFAVGGAVLVDRNYNGFFQSSETKPTESSWLNTRAKPTKTKLELFEQDR